MNMLCRAHLKFTFHLFSGSRIGNFAIFSTTAHPSDTEKQYHEQKLRCHACIATPFIFLYSKF